MEKKNRFIIVLLILLHGAVAGEGALLPTHGNSVPAETGEGVQDVSTALTNIKQDFSGTHDPLELEPRQDVLDCHQVALLGA